jgi:hypothetical protein
MDHAGAVANYRRKRSPGKFVRILAAVRDEKEK